MASPDGPPELEARPQSRREWSGWLRSLVLPIALVVAIVGVLLYIESRGATDDADAGYGTVELPSDKNPTAKDPSAAEGRSAPDFLLPSLDGAALRLSDLQGRPLLVNFWATWCLSCRAEMPALIETYEAYRDHGLIFLGVNLREADDQVRSFAGDFGVSYPVLLDHSGEVARTWRIGGPKEGLPSSYFIDRDGVVQKVVYGSVSAKAMSEGLSLILGPEGN